jgi:Ca2+-binding EF-hand superfamily protein
MQRFIKVSLEVKKNTVKIKDTLQELSKININIAHFIYENPKHRLTTLFKMFDFNRSGFIEAEELSLMVSLLIQYLVTASSKRTTHNPTRRHV